MQLEETAPPAVQDDFRFIQVRKREIFAPQAAWQERLSPEAAQTLSLPLMTS